MLFCTQLARPEDRLKMMSEFDGTKQSWVVADLRSKIDLQNHLLAQKGFFEDGMILRASDLWMRVMKRAYPGFKIVSGDFLKSYLRDRLQNSVDGRDFKSVGIEQLLMDAMTDNVAIWLHPDGAEVFNEWMSASPERVRFEKWYRLAQKFFFEILNEKMVLSKWIAAFLLQDPQWTQFWDRDLIVDLEGELSVTESELLKELSHKTDVMILEPAPLWRDQFRHLLKGYELIRGFAKLSKPTSSVSISQTQALKFTSPLAEVKYATARCRQWLEAGVKPEEIVLLAIKSESYAPLIQAHFAEEGLPLDLQPSTKMHTLPAVSTWLSQLNLNIDQVAFSDLEQVLYQTSQSPILRHEQFRAYYQTLLDASDVDRSSRVAERLDLKPQRFYGSVVEFADLAVEHWPRWGEAAILQDILVTLMTEAVPAVSMSFSNWVYFLETLVSRLEWNPQSTGGGIRFLNTRACGAVGFKHRIFLGVTQSSMQSREFSFLGAKEVNQLAMDYGFYLSHPEQSIMEFQTRWLLEQQIGEDLLCFPTSNLQGDVESPHPLWVAFNPPEDFTPMPIIRWDQIQALESTEALGSLKSWPLEKSKLFEQTIKTDLGEQPIEAAVLQPMPSVSASTIERYRDCPFKFFSEKVLKLLDMPTVDFNLDPRSRGQFVHAIFEKLMTEPIRFNWTNLELDQLFEELRLEVDLPPMDENLWRSFKSRHLLLAQKFQTVEQQWRQRFPQMKIAGLEKAFEFNFNTKTSAIQASADVDTVTFKGKVDRIEANVDGKVVMVDYKSRDDAKFTVTNWMRDNNLQLAIYSWAVDSGLFSNEGLGEVMGAFFYVYKNFERKKGFQIIDENESLYPRKTTIEWTKDAKQKYYQELQAILKSTLEGMLQGQWGPKPRKPEICDNCAWRGQCRAPHLNS